MLTRRYPERSMTPLRSALDMLFEDPWMRWSEGGGLGQPAIDMRETDDAYVIEAEMPGVKPEDVEVTIDGRTLVFRGQFREERETEPQSGRYLVRERRTGTFTRALTLPGGIDPDRVSSKFENGELVITLPKAAEARARRIPIGNASDSARRVGPGSEQSSTQQQSSTQPMTTQESSSR